MERSDTVKAILVLEMPSSCDKCPLFGSHYSDMTCRGNGRGINYPYPKEVRQDWCPLKPIPSKKPTIGKESDNDILCMNAGYNACIDEILGDKE
jgi:hypothetical protein